jgi:hypothetical protein
MRDDFASKDILKMRRRRFMTVISTTHCGMLTGDGAKQAYGACAGIARIALPLAPDVANGEWKNSARINPLIEQLYEEL